MADFKISGKNVITQSGTAEPVLASNVTLGTGIIKSANIIDAATSTVSCTTDSTITVATADTSSLSVGMAVSGTNIPSGAYIVTIPNSTSFTISSAATGGATSTLTFQIGITAAKLPADIEFSGSYMKIPSVTTTQRNSLTPAAGMLIYNSTLGLSQQYTPLGWKSIDATSTITSISPTTQAGYSADVVVTGTNFSTGFTAKFIGADSTQYTPASTVFTSATSVTLRTPTTGLPASKEPFDIQITNTSGLTGTLPAALDAGGVPAFTTSAGTLGNILNHALGGHSLSTAAAADPDGNAITYSISVGALPTGLSFNTATAAITGTATAELSDTTTNFTVAATTANGDVASRAFSITVKGPTVTAFSYTGSNQNFTIPSGVSTFKIYMWAAGGGGGSSNSGGRTGGNGGAGSYVSGTISSYTNNQTFSILVGQANSTGASTDAIRHYGGGGGGSGNSNNQGPGGHGGGRSELSIGGGSNTPAGTRILVAGAGGGAAGSYYDGEPIQNRDGGNGAWSKGESGGIGHSMHVGTARIPEGGGSSQGGLGGTGSQYTGNEATAGYSGIGGMAKGGNQNHDIGYGRPGGGGGGYFGGGGGAGGNQSQASQAGAGGSSYFNTTHVSDFVHETGATNNTDIRNTENTHYASGIARGGTGNKSNNRDTALGGNGRVVVTY